MSSRVVVVVTHDHVGDIDECLDRLAGETVVAVDNASTDGTADRIRAHPSVELIALPRNLGFGRAVNLAARCHPVADVVLVNPDVRISTDVIDHLAGSVAEPGVGAAAPRLRYDDGRVQESARSFPTLMTMLARRTRFGATKRGRAVLAHHHGASEASDPTDVDWALGAALYLRRQAFDEIGQFDERFFVYEEEIDLCIRLREGGWRVRFDPRVEATHHYHRSSRRTWDLTHRPTRLHWRSIVQFGRKHPALVFAGKQPAVHAVPVAAPAPPAPERLGLGAVIVTHNSAGQVETAVDALLAGTHVPDRIVIVDSGSDDTAYLDRFQRDPRVELDLVPDNIGYGRANNRGLRRLGRPDLVLFVNPDLVVGPETVACCVSSLETSEKIGAVGPLLLGTDGTIDSAGLELTWFGRAFDRRQGTPATAAPPSGTVDGLCGACLLGRATALASVAAPHGVFDERFFLYKEDVDLSLRLRAAGWQLRYVAEAPARHARGTPGIDRSRVTPSVRRLSVRNEWRIWTKRLLPAPRRLAMGGYLVAKTLAVLVGR